MKKQIHHDMASTFATIDHSSGSQAAWAVVGIGVTATGLDRLARFVAQLTGSSSLAYVVVLPCHSQTEVEGFLTTLRAVTSLPITLVSRPVPLEVDQVFVIPAGKQLAMSAAHLIISELDNPPSAEVQLELFFRALSEAYHKHAFGILLGDQAPDGSVSLAQIKERGGITFSDRAADASPDPTSLNSSELAGYDLVLPADEMPSTLLRIWDQARHIELGTAVESEPAVSDQGATESEDALRNIVVQLRAVAGHDLERFHNAALVQHIERRMRITGQATLSAYCSYLKGATGEPRALLTDLTSAYPRFFSDARVFKTIKNKVLPELFKSKQDGGDIRVWSAGCATGEEAYSLAMLLLCEKATQQKTACHIQIFATDTNEHAISRARAGRYSKAIAADIRPARLRLFFTQEQGHYRVRDDLREQVLFARQDLLNDPPFSKLDLICCRNVLERLEPAVQRQILRTFHFALRPGGYLVLGTGETTEANADLFSPVDHTLRIYRANQTGDVHPLKVNSKDQHDSLPGNAPLRKQRGASFSEAHQKLLEKHAPPSIVVNHDLEIVYLSDHVGQYLTHSGGQPSHKLVKLAHPQLQPELRAVLLQALRTNECATSGRIRLSRGEHNHAIRLRVEPFEHEETGQMYALVLFEEDRESPLPHASCSEPNNLPLLDVIAQLESELQRTKQQLQATLEQSDVQTEELRAANEELQAINEELRLATRELETSREELQSVNEELITVNEELYAGMEQTSRANSDLQNLITSTNIATLFVDRNLHINWFTPRAANLFSIISSDVGRSLLHITHRLYYDELASDAAQVFESLGQVEREVRSDDGKWYLARHLPYRTNDDHIEGVVLAFIDITGRREAEQKLREKEQLMQLVAESTFDYAIFTMDTEGRVTSWNRGAEFVFGYSEAEMRGRPADIIFLSEDRQAGAPADERKRAREEGRAENERWHVRKDGSRIYGSGTLTPLGEDQLRGYVKICRDLTQRKQQEMAQELELERSQTAIQRKDQFFAMMSHELKHPLNLVQLNAELLSRLPVVRNSGVMSKASHAIMQAVRNQAQIIDDLLDLSRARTGKLRLKRTDVDLDQVIAEILNGVHSEIVESRLEMIYDPRSAMGLVLNADPTRVEQVVWNLISNALKFTPSRGRIELVLQREDEMARLDVIDNGPGIDPAHLPHMFDLFDQADNHQALRHKDGLGIGLALVRELTEAHGGRAEAYSEGLGKGARFSVWLPLQTQPAELRQPTQETASGRLEGLKVMLVDDSPDVVETLQLLLELEGAVVTTANCGQEALDLLCTGSHEVLISDIGMPGMDGHQLIEAVRSRCEGDKIRAIALTGFASSEDVKRASSAGFDRHIGKPVSLDVLIEAVETVVEPRKDRHQ